MTSFLKIDRAIFSTNNHNKFVLIAMRNFTMRKKVNRIIRRVQFCKNPMFVRMEKICYFVKVGNNSIILPWTCISYYFLNDFYEVRLKNAVATHLKNNTHCTQFNERYSSNMKVNFGTINCKTSENQIYLAF